MKRELNAVWWGLGLVSCLLLTSSLTPAMEAMEELPDPVPATGTLKIGSAPLDCTVYFRGQMIDKNMAVVTRTGVPAGRYPVLYVHEGRRVEKSVVVRPGKVTFVFGNLTELPPPGAVAKKDQGTEGPLTLASAATEQAEQTNGRAIEDADMFFDMAEMLRKAVNPFRKAPRYKRAERIYLKILRRWPDCDKASDCRYQLGRIYESLFYRDYEQAIAQYKELLEHDFGTEHPARWRIAVLYENRLKDFPSAREWYELAAKHSKDAGIQEKATKEAEALRKKGH